MVKYELHCDVCGNRVETFKALANLTYKYSEFNQQIQLMQDEYMKLKLYKPHLLTIKTLEKQQRESNRIIISTRNPVTCYML